MGVANSYEETSSHNEDWTGQVRLGYDLELFSKFMNWLRKTNGSIRFNFRE